MKIIKHKMHESLHGTTGLKETNQGSTNLEGGPTSPRLTFRPCWSWHNSIENGWQESSLVCTGLN